MPKKGSATRCGNVWLEIFAADAHREGAGRFIVRADEKLTAFVELESATRMQL